MKISKQQFISRPRANDFVFGWFSFENCDGLPTIIRLHHPDRRTWFSEKQSWYCQRYNFQTNEWKKCGNLIIPNIQIEHVYRNEKPDNIISQYIHQYAEYLI